MSKKSGSAFETSRPLGILLEFLHEEEPKGILTKMRKKDAAIRRCVEAEAQTKEKVKTEETKKSAIRVNDGDKPRGVLAEIYEHNMAVRRKEKEEREKRDHKRAVACIIMRCGHIKRCPICGHIIDLDQSLPKEYALLGMTSPFRNSKSRYEYSRSGMCQDCQDDKYGRED